MTGMKDVFGDEPYQLTHGLRTIGWRKLEPYPQGIPEDVAELFERIALNLYQDGRRHFSSDAILHRIRWYYNIEKRDDSFKCNNNWTAQLARWFMLKHPDCAGFFELRSSPHEDR